GVAGMVQFGRGQIRDVNEILTAHDIHKTGPSGHRRWLAHKLDERGRHGVRGSYSKSLAVVKPKNTKFGSAQPSRLLENCCEDRREIAGRAVDHLQHLGGGGLLLSRPLEFAG